MAKDRSYSTWGMPKALKDFSEDLENIIPYVQDVKRASYDEIMEEITPVHSYKGRKFTNRF